MGGKKTASKPGQIGIIIFPYPDFLFSSILFSRVELHPCSNSPTGQSSVTAPDGSAVIEWGPGDEDGASYRGSA